MNTTSSQLIPLSLYIHVPWCERKCPYCDFNSHTADPVIPEKEYIQALLADLQHDLEWVQNREISSIFIGGGTPSLFSPESYQQLFEGLQKDLTFSRDIEITLEANPGSTEQQKFTEFHATGINRLSIGIQSFNDDMLSKLGRIHNSKEAIKAAEAAHYAGFTNFNLDLMFALPGQNSRLALKDLEYATSLEPSHLSWYQLTIEPNTLFHQHPPVLPQDDIAADIQSQGQDYLHNKQYDQYEISAYAKSAPCRHNLNYWQFGDYLGLGAGAHSKLSNPVTDSIIRKQRRRHPKDYIQQAHSLDVISQIRKLSESDRVLEFMMNALRLNNGTDYQQFEQRTGLDIDIIQDKLQLARDKQLMTECNNIQASTHGLLYLNNLLEIFMETSND